MYKNMFIKLSDNKPLLKNQAQWAKTYTFKFLEQGLVSYDDMKLGTLLLRKETIENMIPSFIDKPVIIKHRSVDEHNFTDLAVGYIKNVYFNSIDGWYYADCLITHDEAHDKLQNGWGVSCAYKVNNIISGGKYHNIDYDGEIVNGIGEHLALVENPRYEECFMAVNGKNAYLYNEKTFQQRKNKQEDTPMFFNLFGKKTEKGFDGNAVVDLGNGKKAKLADIIAFNNSIEEQHNIDGAQEITLANGQKMKLEDAVKAYALANVATDDKEKEDEEKAKKEAEGKKEKEMENAKKMQNCGCGGKDGKHMDDCTMYNADGSDKEDMKDKKEKMENEVKRLRLENEALKASIQHGTTFVKIENSSKENVDDVSLANGTTHSGTIEDKLENSKKHFGPSMFDKKV